MFGGVKAVNGSGYYSKFRRNPNSFAQLYHILTNDLAQKCSILEFFRSGLLENLVSRVPFTTLPVWPIRSRFDLTDF